MRIYISGPISGTEDYRDRFKDATLRLKAAGFTFYNPAAIEDALPGGTWQQYMAIDQHALGWCDGLLQLPGWQNSQGAVHEFDLAKELGLLIFTLNDFPDTLLEGGIGYIDGAWKCL